MGDAADAAPEGTRECTEKGLDEKFKEDFMAVCGGKKSCDFNSQDYVHKENAPDSCFNDPFGNVGQAKVYFQYTCKVLPENMEFKK